MEIYKGSLQLTVQAKLSAKGFLHFLQRNIFAENVLTPSGATLSNQRTNNVHAFFNG